ncbi:MAG: hypothetical protein ABFD58_13770, partial [Anaerolineaceae bacterium]
SLKVDRVRFTHFLFENGYYSGEGIWKSAKITLTNEKQPFMAVTSSFSLPPFQSVTIKNDQKSMNIIAHYDNSVLEEILTYKDYGQKRLNWDILAYVCVAQTKNKTGLYEKDGCYKKAMDYLESNDPLIFELERESIKTGFHLVGTAHAAGCTGLVECELGETSCTCSVGGASCPSSCTNCCGGGLAGDCTCTFSCTGSGGGAMDYYYCSSNTTRASCLSAGGAEALCQGKDMCAVGGGCFWINDDGTIATPSPGGGGGGCTCNCMSATNPGCDSSRIGLWNVAFKTGGGNTTPVGESYITTVPNYLPSGLNICADAGSISRVVSFFRPHPIKNSI